MTSPGRAKSGFTDSVGLAAGESRGPQIKPRTP
jgi:hypothetical protein